MDYFDASINRVAAWVIGMRNMQRALMGALLTPHAAMKQLQDEGKFTELFVMSEELKSYPEGIVWEEFCNRCGVPADQSWFAEVQKYEQTVLATRK
jgi:L-rhamnose isomerase